MIRVHLQAGQRQAQRPLRWLIAMAVVAVAATGVLRLVDGYYPLAGAWNRLAADAVTPGAVGASPATGPATTAQPEVAPSTVPLEAMAAAVAAPPTGSGDGHLYRSATCARILALPRQLPADVELTSLTGRADGRYAFEGLVPAARVVELLSALDSLSPEAQLSYWRGGRLRAEPYYKFIFNGRLPAEPQARLAAVDGRGTRALTDEVSRRAQSCGLVGMHLDEPVDVALGPGRLHRRYQCRATGAIAQIRAFLGELGELGESVAVGELRVVPGRGGLAPGGLGPDTSPAQLHAALDLVVAAATGVSATYP